MIRNALLAFALTIPAWPAWTQDGTYEERVPIPGERDIFGRPLREESAGEMLLSMQGAWRLIDIEDEFLPTDGRELTGYMLIAKKFLSLEIHMTWLDIDGEPLEDAFQSGVHEFRFTGSNRIVSRGLIGSFLDEDDELAWEQPGQEREFDIQVDGEQLRLVRDDQSLLVFVRQHPVTDVVEDIFGIPEGTTDQLSIFGTPESVEEELPEGDDDDEQE